MSESGYDHADEIGIEQAPMRTFVDVEHAPVPPWAIGVITGLTVGFLLNMALLIACLAGALH